MGRRGLILKRTLQNVRKYFFQIFNQTQYVGYGPAKIGKRRFGEFLKNSQLLIGSADLNKLGLKMTAMKNTTNLVPYMTGQRSSGVI